MAVGRKKKWGWMACDRCGLRRLVATKKSKCILTPSCRGLLTIPCEPPAGLEQHGRTPDASRAL